jgi:hypothetical protein
MLPHLTQVHFVLQNVALIASVFQVDPSRPVRIPGDSDASNMKRNVGQGGIVYTIDQINWAVSCLHFWFYTDRKSWR